MAEAPLSRRARGAVLVTALLALLFDGMELGLMPVASLSIARDMLGRDFTLAVAGDWFARLTASLLLGAAVGGLLLGALGDRLGRTRALALSVLVYALFAGAGAFAQTLDQMLLLRFLVGLGVGGVWPNAVALLAESWPDTSRPTVAGIAGASMNGGILLLSQIARLFPITADAWRWLFAWSALPAVLGVVVWLWVPESPMWRAGRAVARAVAPVRALFRGELLRRTLVGIALGSIPMVGAWAGSKWVIPWADAVAGPGLPTYKATTQGYWAAGATVGSFVGAQLARALGRRASYVAISVGALVLTGGVFLWARPLTPSFLPLIFGQGLVGTLFFGWLPLYLPELFPTHVRATGAGVAYNFGRFFTAAGVLGGGSLVLAFDGDYAAVGAACSAVYGLGLLVIWWAPETGQKALASR
jgi:MFS family permease